MPVAHSATGFLVRLGDDDRASLLELGQERSHRSGTTLLREADMGRHVVVLLAGTAKVQATRPDGSAAILALRRAGDIVGELAVVGGGSERRSASVVALEPLRGRAIPAAGLAGASRESVVRALAELRHRGWVATSPRSLVVTDLDALHVHAR